LGKVGWIGLGDQVTGTESPILRVGPRERYLREKKEKNA